MNGVDRGALKNHRCKLCAWWR